MSQADETRAMPEYKKIVDLPEEQRDVLGWLAIDRMPPESETLKLDVNALLDLGLIEIQARDIPGRRPRKQEKRVAVPIRVHMAWCQWCSDNVEDTE